MSKGLRLKNEISARKVKVSISGEIDIFTAQEFKENLYSLIESNKLDLVIDCSGLNYLDSVGLGIFVGALKKTKLNNNSIYLDNLSDNIKKLFIITGLDKVFILG